MRHSLFFETFDEADKAERIITGPGGPKVTDCYQSNDGESRLVEVRFFTDAQLGEFDQRYLLGKTKPATYALNCED